jgi:hypothetical protein
MNGRSLQSVSVWFDHLSKDEGAFTEGLEWACRLNLPLRVVLSPQNLAADSKTSQQTSPKPPADPDKMKRWQAACALRGITMDLTFSGNAEMGISQYLRPYSLCVLEEDRGDWARQKLLAQSRWAKDILVLLTPPVCKPLKRVLILYHHCKPNAYFLESATKFCQALDIHPILLTVAASDKETMLKQSFAERACAAIPWRVDFDSVVSQDTEAAVQRIAGWRNCDHVIFQHVGHNFNNSLWSRDDGDIFAPLRNQSRSLAVVAFPEPLALDLAPLMRDNPLEAFKN